MYTGFTCHWLNEVDQLWTGQLPEDLWPTSEAFTQLWDLHPEDYHTIQMLGKPVKTPRWQQAYHKTYHYSGGSNPALPVPQELLPYWDWAKSVIDQRLNALLLNWYEGQWGHYIGKHRDSTTFLIKGSPIVTLSLGDRRVFRLRPWQGKGFLDFPARQGTVFVMPYTTNLRWTHEVPATSKWQGRRISITLRAFR